MNEHLRSCPESMTPPVDLAARIELYLADMPSDGGHSDAAGGDCWDLLREAMEELRPPAQAPTMEIIDREYYEGIIAELKEAMRLTRREDRKQPIDDWHVCQLP